MKPHQLWAAIGATISAECKCTHCWQMLDGTEQEIGEVNAFQRSRIINAIKKLHYELVEPCGGTQMSSETSCIAGKAPCGCYRYALAGEIMACDLRDIGRMLRHGWAIEIKPVSFVHNGGLNFKCEHKSVSPQAMESKPGAKVGA